MIAKSKDDTTIYYNVVGSGPPILLLHGFSNDSSVWEQTGWINRLKNDFTVITLDFRGCGHSEKLKDQTKYQLESHCMDINCVLDKLKIENPIIWGWSFGATVALHYAKSNSVKALFSAGTYFGLIFSDQYINERILETKDEVNIERWKALKNWPVIFPNEIKIPFYMYSGSKDGNVVKQLIQQKNEIIKANGKLIILIEVDHFGLISCKEKIECDIIPLIYLYLKIEK